VCDLLPCVTGKEWAENHTAWNSAHVVQKSLQCKFMQYRFYLAKLVKLSDNGLLRFSFIIYLITTIRLFSITLAPERGAKYCDERVDMSVCLSARMSTSISCCWRTCATCCITANVLQTKVDAQCDKRATELSWQRLWRSTFSTYSELFVESSHF